MSQSTKTRGRSGGRSRTGTGSSRRILLVVAGAVVGLGLISIVLAGQSTNTETDHPDLRAAPHIDGDWLPAFAGADQATGSLVPTVSGTDFAGKPVAIERNGIPKMLLFLAHWCSHCQAEVPEVGAWLEQNSIPDGVELISIATAMDPSRANFPASDWLESEDWPVQVVVDNAESSIYRAYGAGGFPFWAMVDSEGRLITRISGAGQVDLDMWLSALRTG